MPVQKHTEETRKRISSSMKRVWNERKERMKKADTRIRLVSSTAKRQIMNALVSRSVLGGKLGHQFAGKRKLYDVLGYIKNPQFSDYLAFYLRESIAKRIVEAPSKATWRRRPIVFEDDPRSISTEFERRWEELSTSLRVFSFLQRADVVSGIGRFGVLMIGTSRDRSIEDLQIPLEPGSLSGPEDITSLAPFAEGSVDINDIITDPSNPRFGMPEFYTISIGDPSTSSGVPAEGRDAKVHWTRIIHIAEGRLEDELFGIPRLQPVLNLLFDLQKVSGGSAEMFWQGAYRGLHVDIRPDEVQLGDLSDAELTKLAQEIDEYIDGLQRVIRTQGVDIKTLDAQVADPSGVFDVIITLISGATGIPKRILFGSERGELASEQDEVQWNARIKERQEQFAEPDILRAFIDRLIFLGALPNPENGYHVEWPSLFEMSDKEQALVKWTLSRAIKAASPSGDPGLLMKPEAIIRKVFGFRPEEVLPDSPPAPADISGTERPEFEEDKDSREDLDLERELEKIR